MTSQQQEISAHIKELENVGMDDIVTSSSEEEPDSESESSLHSQIDEEDEEDAASEEGQETKRAAKTQEKEMEAGDLMALPDGTNRVGHSNESGFFQMQLQANHNQRKMTLQQSHNESG